MSSKSTAFDSDEALLVALVHVGDGLVVEGRDALLVLRGADEVVLGGRDLVVDAARDEPLRVLVELFEDLLGQPDLVGLVVDREVRAVAEPLGLAPEDAPAGGVEREDPVRCVPEHGLEPLAHLACGLVGEGDGQDLVRLHPAGVDQVRDAMREHTRLAGARAGDDEEGPFGVDDGFPLRGVEISQVGLG